MAITISIPTPLRQFVGGKSEVELDAATAGEALAKLTTQFPALRKHLFNDQDALRNFINVYVGDEDIRHLDVADTPGREGETLIIVPSIDCGSAVPPPRTETSLPELTNEEYERYSRHWILP